MQLSTHVGVPVPASAILFEAVRFALSVAEDTGGAFDPTVGRRMEARGFNREHRTGQTVRSPFPHDDGVDAIATSMWIRTDERSRSAAR